MAPWLRVFGRRTRRARPLRRTNQRGRGPVLALAVVLAPLAGLGWAYAPEPALEAHVPAAHRPEAQPHLPWLRADGHHILDDSGRVVLLRGFNSDALLEPGERHADLDEEDATLMAQAGFTVVRLPVSWGLLEPQRGRIDGAYLDKIVATIDMLNRHGLYVIVDMHIRDWSAHYGGSGAPDWASAAVVPDTQGLPWDLLRTHLDPAMQASTTYFWTSPDWQADFAATWRALATRLRDRSGVAGWDLYNEPHPLPIPPRIFERDYMWPFYQRLIEQIGSVDSNHLFIVEGTFFGNFGTTVRTLRAPNLVYAPHVYTGSLVPPAWSGDPGPLRQRIAEQAAEAGQLPAPFLSGELGIDRATAGSTGWADAALDALDDVGAGWAWWQWRESLRWGIRDHDGTHVDLGYLEHLSRPFLAAAPSGVHAGRGDGVAGRLALEVDAGSDGQRLDVAWPGLTHPGQPKVDGACVRVEGWNPAAGRLSLAVVGGSACVVTVSAG